MQNLHTHTCYCDGADTAEEVVLAAIDKGFASIGFSGHSYMHYAFEHSMSMEGTEEYKKEIAILKEKYRACWQLLFQVLFLTGSIAQNNPHPN